MYACISKLLSPGGIYIICSVNDINEGWFEDYVLKELIENSSGYRFYITVHIPSIYTDGEKGAPNVYVIRKSLKANLRDGMEPYIIEMKEH
jgi:hypothetical protein